MRHLSLDEGLLEKLVHLTGLDKGIQKTVIICKCYQIMCSDALMIVSKFNGNFSTLTTCVSDSWNAFRLNSLMGSFMIISEHNAQKVQTLIELLAIGEAFLYLSF